MKEEKWPLSLFNMEGKMKNFRVFLVFFAAAAFIEGNVCFSQEEESGIIVYGESEILSEEKDEFLELEEEEDGMALEPKRLMIEIKGSRFGDSAVSKAVALLREGVISHIDVGMGQGATIVRVDEETGVERQVYCFDQPWQAVGKKLPAGRYKVYPDNLNRDFEIGEITAVMSIELTEDMNSELTEEDKE